MSTVVIVGRKNVGKSTVFNRLTGMRLSVVYREPGVTRDRIYGAVEWRGRVFDFIDTGGFFPDEANQLANKITKQIDYGLAEADLIYFIVDGKEGLKPADEAICQHLRKTNKKIFLLVNKIDNRQSELKALEFSRLGFDNTFIVSAEAGIGFGDVLDKTLEMLPRMKRIKADKVIKVLILGRPNAGKSTLLNTMTDSERAIVDEEPGTTRDLVVAKFTFRDKKMEIIDTCGLRKPSRVRKSVEFYSMVRAMKVIELADVVILVFDSTQGVVEQDRRIASLVLSKAKGLVIAPNKIDLIDTKNSRRITPSTYRSFISLEFVPIVPISAVTKAGVTTLIDRVLDIYSENRKVVDKNVLRTLTRNLQAPPGGELLHLKQVGSKPPLFNATLTTPVKENYIKYVRHSIRHYFGFSGVPLLIKTRVVKKRHFR